MIAGNLKAAAGRRQGRLGPGQTQRHSSSTLRHQPSENTDGQGRAGLASVHSLAGRTPHSHRARPTGLETF